MSNSVKIAVLVSGGGTNLQAIIDKKQSGGLKNAEIDLVASNNSEAFALTRAKNAGIDTMHFERFDALADVLEARKIGLIVLAGFLKILPPEFICRFEGKIINIHPSLIPDFCGEGMYGLKVHEAVLSAGVAETGATVHYVTAEVDAGPIIIQKRVAVQKGDTPEILQQRVMTEAEHIILPQAIEEICD